MPVPIIPIHLADRTIPSAATNPTLNFSVIINPCSGPCVNGIPQSPYLTELPRLKDYPNIRTLGYVATNYTNKPIEDLLVEIRTYNYWTSTLNDSRVAVDGIFFDETPGPYHWQKHDYLATATKEVKASPGLGQQIVGSIFPQALINSFLTAPVVHNPGAIPYIPWNYLDLADITVIFEETFTNFLDAPKFNALKTLHTDANVTKNAFALMLHTVPNIPTELLDWTVHQMKEMAGYGFLSSVGVPGEYWHSFSTIFTPFVQRFAVVTEQ